MSAWLLYDGTCGLCTRSQSWLLARIEPGRVAPRDTQHCSDAELAALGVSRALVEQVLCWVDADGTVRLGTAAVAAALRATRGWTAPLGALLDRPLVAPGAARVYRLVARHRHRIMPAATQCRLPHHPRSVPPGHLARPDPG